MAEGERANRRRTQFGVAWAGGLAVLRIVGALLEPIVAYARVAQEQR